MNLQLRFDTQGALLTGSGPAIVQKNLDQAVTEVTLFLDTQVKARTPQGVNGAQGGLLGSIQNEVQGKGTPLVKGIVLSNHPTAAVIEKGRKPGKGVPHGVLIPWIEKKIHPDTPEELERIEFLIRMKIKAKGFKGAHMFENAVNENWGAVQGIFNRYGITITQELSE